MQNAEVGQRFNLLPILIRCQDATEMWRHLYQRERKLSRGFTLHSRLLSHRGSHDTG